MNAAVDDKKMDDATPRGIVRKWKNEIQLAERRFQAWWKEADQYYDIYEAESQTQNSYNILWSNTEVLRPALYNSTPTPDVRRRFRDEDVLGKTVSKVLQRALDYTVDDYEAEDFDDEMKGVVLDTLITGRGKARVKYVPVFVPMPESMGQPAIPPVLESEQPLSTPDLDAQAAPPPEMVADESAKCEYVYFKDYLHGPGKKWSQVPWEAYRHCLDRDELVQMFGPEIGAKVPLDEAKKDEKTEDKDLNDNDRTAEVWEIWDKRSRRAIFINKQFDDQPLLDVEDPLQLAGFFPGPKPLYAIESTRSLIPIPPYRLYKQQAKELNKITARINVITDHMRVRGAYAAGITEIGNILKLGDGEMAPIVNVTQVAAAGGLDKALWMMPIDALAAALQQLYLAREQIKQVIAELTGLSDIIRGSTNPNETKGAQQLKSQWGTLRLQRLQREVQRFARDLIRLLGEIISSQFSPEKLAAITQVQLPTPEEKQQAQMAVQQAEMAAQQAQAMPPQVDPATGQPVPPPGPPPEAVSVLEQPTWEDVMGVLKSDELRGYKVDVETDSTVAETIDRDMAGLSEVLQALGQFLQIVGPMVQQGFLPIDAAKEIALTICRRARMGSAVEDQIQSIGGQQQQGMMQQAQQPLQDGLGQIMQALQELGKRGDDLGNGVQNGLQDISNQIRVAIENVGRQQQPRAA